MRCLLLCILTLLMACQVQAHQMKAAMTKVLFNQRSGNVEIMHRFYVHDAEHALTKILGKQVHLLDDEDSQRMFGRYISAHFDMRISGAADKTLDEVKEYSALLSYVGQEVDGKFIWVYQEVSIPETVSSLRFRNDALQDHWPEQVNQINVEGLGKVRSLRFDREKNWQSLDF